jgi:hypothetical protein
LIEHLVALDHPQLEARTLLDGVEALLEVADFGIEGFVARPGFRVGVADLGELVVELPHAHPASLAHPQRPLQGDEEGREDGGEDLHAETLTPSLPKGGG